MQRGRVHEMSFALQCSTYVAERAGSRIGLGSGEGRSGLGLCVSIRSAIPGGPVVIW